MVADTAEIGVFGGSGFYSLLDDVRGWLAGLRRWEQANAGRLAHQPMPVFDDVTVLRIARQDFDRADSHEPLLLR